MMTFSWRRTAALSFGLSTILAAGALAFLSLASAHAETVTVGSPLKATFGGSLGSAPTGTWANTALPEPGAHVSSPVSGVIVRWHMTGNYSVGDPFELRVLEPASPGEYKGAGTSSPVTPTGGMQTFATNLPIKEGDLIGLNVNNGFIGAAGVSASHVVDWFPALPDGSTLAPPYFSNDTELGFNAEVQPPPGITSASPTSGPISGGTSVAITGHDFAGVSAVKFGSSPALSFTVNAESQITSAAPPSATACPVNISVTTGAGTATSTQPFTYVACVVPKLKGKKLKTVGKKLKAADCKLGKVKGKKGKSAKVKTQSPKPGTVLVPESKVNVKVA